MSELPRASEGIDQRDIDVEGLAEARARLRRGEFRDCLWELSKALGPDFDRLNEIVPEQPK